MPRPILRTTRLVLRPRALSDLDACVAMDLDPAVNLYLPGLRMRSLETHRTSEMQRIESEWPSIGGIWVVEENACKSFLGWCGLFPLENTGLVQIGFRYVPASWNRGIATEAASAVLDYGFRGIDLDPIVAVTHPENVASLRVLQKVRMRRNGTGIYYDQELHFSQLTRAEYQAALLQP